MKTTGLVPFRFASFAGVLLLMSAHALAGRPDDDPGRALDYPEAPRGDVVDDYHGTPVADPYRWMEDLDSTQTRAWVDAQVELFESFMEDNPEWHGKSPTPAEALRAIREILGLPETGGQPPAWAAPILAELAAMEKK